jgi:hypothetical protein
MCSSIIEANWLATIGLDVVLIASRREASLEEVFLVFFRAGWAMLHT